MNPAVPIVSSSAPGAERFGFDAVPRLTAALQRGDEEAYAWLHRAWSARISRYCFALAAGDELFAADIAQAAWLRLVRHARILPDESALWNWIACAARHAAVDLRRKGGRYLRALQRFAEWWPLATRAAVEEEDGLNRALEVALGELPPLERALIEARYFAGDSLEVMGARHALSVRAVEGRLARLRERLRERIAEHLRSRRT